MRTRTLIRGFSPTGLSLFAGALLCAGSIAAADQTYTLKPHVSRGDKWAFDASNVVKEKGQMLANGQLAQPIDQAIEQHRKGTIEVLSVENGLPSAMLVNFDAESSNTGTAGGQQVPAFVLARKSVHLSRKDGIVTTDLGNDVDPPTVQEVSHMLDPDLSIYPKTPVAVNDEWEGDTTELAKTYQLAANDKITMRCKLGAVREVDGRQVAEIIVSGSMLKHEQGFVETRIAFDATSHVDIQTGQVVGSDMLGKVTARGAQQVPGQDGALVNLSVSADGTVEVKQAIKPVNVAAAGGGFEAANAHPANPAPGNPAPANPLADAPAVPTDAAATFSGAYKGDQVALDLTSSAGDYTGLLTVGDKKFPVAAKPDGAKLTGHFESEGTRFEFTASLDANTLTLTSEGNVYTLKKLAGNPLARPALKNPLGQ